MKAPAFWWRHEAGPFTHMLAPFAAAVDAVAVRRMARAPAGRLGVPVVCIGNPTVGGAGKTPIAIALAKALAASGEQPAFLTRGYGGKAGGPRVVAPDDTAQDVGDEALLLAEHAPTVVCADRVAGGRVAEGMASVIIMDDGFQNPSLDKDYSVLVIDSAAGIGNGRVTPAGPLRARLLPQLERADAVLLVHGSEPHSARHDLAELCRGIAVFTVSMEVSAPVSLAGVRVLAFAGIGRPQKFFAGARALGAEVVDTVSLGDHAQMGERRAAALMSRATDEGLTLLTTRKDEARLRGGTPSERALARQAVIVEVRAKLEPQFVEAVSACLTDARARRASAGSSTREEPRATARRRV
ncbi:MAG: tetraacyldisaccharide 4'-kinase [Pseudomonadota bacterium]